MTENVPSNPQIPDDYPKGGLIDVCVGQMWNKVNKLGGVNG